ncbi:hypothetical protein Lepto7376_1789 [[Leptolyngbya] sp. PCC 7376]|uniref:LmeA family phospholipid-binding protein n=1 Tax=[Leptolyngbya] sp. PCC 7376 TaxID=111781 RepID=UPI00029EC64C|nr:DUF2993 domain-containing protein [[Leptolyngbya] sp. PCC 7376]AFY38118.1 hypothetical protein Lepto7376_1789 [[Leptolyngbya] sp. PCC 7376]
MEILTILLSGLLSAGAPVGLIVEEITDKQFSQRLESAETFEVRIDNLPAHKIIDGEIDKIRIASRGVEIVEGFRLEALELETDPLNIDLKRLRQRQFDSETFREPVQAGLRLVLTEDDLNESLRSPRVRRVLQPLINRLLVRPGSPKPPQYQLDVATIDFVGENRFEFNGDISQLNPQTGETEYSKLTLSYKLQLTSGSEIQWLEGTGTINNRPLPSPAIMGFSQGMSGRLNLQRFDERGVTARFFAFNLDDTELETALFLKFEPTSEE